MKNQDRERSFRGAYEAGAEMQIAIMEFSGQWVLEMSSFMAKRTHATANDMVRMAAARTPVDLFNAQIDRMNGMVRDYSEEAGRLADIAERSARQTKAAGRS